MVDAAQSHRHHYIQSIGCDRPVIYTEEDLDTVLKTEYPKGVNVVYEVVGGQMFETALNNIAHGGRVIVLGAIDNYQKKGVSMMVADASIFNNLPLILIEKCATLAGFGILHNVDQFPIHLPKLISLYDDGKLKVTTDNGEDSVTGKFVGVDMVADALEHMYSKKNKGKVIVELNPDTADTQL